MYHLHSIRIASDTISIDSNFLNHIIKSLKNNLKIDVHEEEPNYFEI